MSQEIIVDISRDGTSVTVEGKGIEGPDCKALTAEIEEALGVVTERKLKPEYHRARSAARTKTV